MVIKFSSAYKPQNAEPERQISGRKELAMFQGMIFGIILTITVSCIATIGEEDHK
jgi:hypothetical protein